jgi:hypothetical protein
VTRVNIPAMTVTAVVMVAMIRAARSAVSGLKLSVAGMGDWRGSDPAPFGSGHRRDLLKIGYTQLNA